MGVFEITWHEGLWACIYKRVERKWWTEMQKKLCWEREKWKSLETLNQKKTNNSLETLSEGNKK